MNDAAIESFVGLLSGLTGGAASVYVSQPMDTIKVKMQAFPDIYKKTFACVQETLLKDGLFRGFYAGALPALCGSISENTVLFAAIPLSRRFISYICGKKSEERLNLLQLACSGSLCGFLTSLVMCPNELIKCRIQSIREISGNRFTARNRPKIHPWQVANDICKKEGVKGLYRGYSCTLAREIPGLFCYIGGNEFARAALAGKGQCTDNLSPMKTAVAGGFGGFCLWTVVFPLDSVKSRIQIGRISTVAVPNSEPNAASFFSLQPSVFQTLCTIVRTEGILSLYRGLAPTLLRTIPATGALFVVVEETKKFGRFLRLTNGF